MMLFMLFVYNDFHSDFYDDVYDDLYDTTSHLRKDVYSKEIKDDNDDVQDVDFEEVK